MTEAEKLAVSNAREAILAMSDEEPTFVSGSVRAAPGGYDVLLVTQQGTFSVHTSADGRQVESVVER